MKSFVVCILFLGFGGNAWSMVDFYIATGFPHDSFEERGTAVADHSTPFGFSLGLGTKLRMEAGPFLFGIVGEASWAGMNANRRITSGAASDDYRVEKNRALLGPSLGISLASFLTLEADYYALSNAEISYSDGKKDKNPFLKGDRLSGTGYGVGLSFRIWHILIGGMYRRLTATSFDHMGLSDASVKTSDLVTEEGLGTLGFFF